MAEQPDALALASSVGELGTQPFELIASQGAALRAFGRPRLRV